MLPSNQTLSLALQEKGIDRRRFLKFCSLMTATLALPPRYVAQVASALGRARKPVLVWLQFQDCAGNSESILRSSHPSVLEIVVDLLSWEYHELVMAGAGHQAEAALERVVKEEKGKFIAVVEGAIPLADGGVYCTVGGRTAIEIARHVCPNAAATIAAGDCAWDGGLVAASPNPTGAVGIEEAVPAANVINLGGCPQNPVNTAAVLVHYLTFGSLPATDQYHRPLFAYGRIIHDQCERRAHYDAGRFVQEWGDEGHRKGWCLYKMGCKGPEATFNCPSVRWNDGTSWPVKAGHGCLGCASHRFWDTRSPFYERLPKVPGFGVDVTAGEIGLAVTGAVAGATIVHGIASAIRDRARSTSGPAPPPNPRPPESTPLRKG
ncbi:MAG TPA: hydrogenase small subunit [Terriglobales bacterium]|nr:hydrogenase small subunit [Terriglobales bacterium]